MAPVPGKNLAATVSKASAWVVIAVMVRAAAVIAVMVRVAAVIVVTVRVAAMAMVPAMTAAQVPASVWVVTAMIVVMVRAVATVPTRWLWFRARQQQWFRLRYGRPLKQRKRHPAFFVLHNEAALFNAASFFGPRTFPRHPGHSQSPPGTLCAPKRMMLRRASRCRQSASCA